MLPAAAVSKGENASTTTLVKAQQARASSCARDTAHVGAASSKQSLLAASHQRLAPEGQPAAGREQERANSKERGRFGAAMSQALARNAGRHEDG